MAVTSLWRVKGYVGKVILYAMDEKKTTEKEIIQTGNDDTSPEAALNDLISYAERAEATVKKQYVSGINCDPVTVREEMMNTKRAFHKLGGTVAYHGYQSFAEGEVTPEKAHDIGFLLAQELWGERFEVLVTTHLDKDSHLHNHFVINTVSCLDGFKYHRTKKDYLQMRQVSDRLCREYSLSVIDKPQGHGKNYAQWRAEQNGEYTKDTIIKRDIDECVELSLTVKQFYQEMAKRGYKFNFEHKYATVFHPNFQRARRLKTLGDEYTPESIERRISGHVKPKKLVPPEQDDPEKLFFDGNCGDSKILSDYQSTLVHYVYGFTIIRQRPNQNRYLMRILSEEHYKFDRRVEEQNLMLDNDLHTPQDIEKYRAMQNDNLSALELERQILRNKMKREVRAGNEGAQMALRSQISALSERIDKIRRKIRTCDRLLEDKPVVESKMHEIQDYTQRLKRKERERNEHVGRRC